MSGIPDEVLRLDSKSRFMVDVEMADPDTGQSVDLPCEIDTGNPTPLALPDSLTSEFSDYLGDAQFGGAAKDDPGEVYGVDITRIGSTRCSHNTAAYFVLEADREYGLIGIELLSYCITLIHDGPADLKLELELTHI